MRHARKYTQNRLELIGAAAAVIACVVLLWGVASEKQHERVGQLYVIENGKWLPVEGVN